jgi:hypothetical protein
MHTPGKGEEEIGVIFGRVWVLRCLDNVIKCTIIYMATEIIPLFFLEFWFYLACGDLEEDYPSHVYIMGNLGLTYSRISD